MKQIRSAIEEDFRRQFAEVSSDEVKASDEMRLCADPALASVPELERLYLKDGNPIHVWDAILQIISAMLVLGKPKSFPPWILANLYCATLEIMGKAVAYPSGDRHAPTETTRNPDGTTHVYSDYFRGLTAAQRCDVVMEALRFKGASGSNLLAQAHRDLNAELSLRQIEIQTSRGLSVTAAARTVNDPRLNMSNDPARKVRRDRKRLRGGGT
jgi:hypothetical protein